MDNFTEVVSDLTSYSKHYDQCTYDGFHSGKD